MEKKKEGKHALEDFDKKKKLPKELKNKQNVATIKNVLIAIFVTIYFILLNMGYQNIIKKVYITDVRVFALVILGIAIILFERSFRKHKGELAIYGLEMLVLCTITLFVPYIYYLNTETTNILMIILIISFDVYYVAKATVICAKIQSDYNATISDVKTIVKKEKRKLEEDDDELISEDITMEEEKEEDIVKDVKAVKKISVVEEPVKKNKVKTTKKVDEPKTNTVKQTSTKTKVKTAEEEKELEAKTVEKNTRTTGKTKTSSRSKTAKETKETEAKTAKGNKQTTTKSKVKVAKEAELPEETKTKATRKTTKTEAADKPKTTRTTKTNASDTETENKKTRKTTTKKTDQDSKETKITRKRVTKSKEEK